jgi:hypothetical protein
MEVVDHIVVVKDLFGQVSGEVLVNALQRLKSVKFHLLEA